MKLLFFSHLCSLMCVVEICFSILYELLWQMMDTHEFPFLGPNPACFFKFLCTGRTLSALIYSFSKYTLASTLCRVAQK